MSRRVILSDSSLNRYGYRILTEGIDLTSFRKNPLLLYMHLRDEGSPLWGQNKAIGHWKDIKVEDGVLSAEPVFDEVDELSKTIAAKFNAGTFNAASIGIRIIATSDEKKHLVPGQTRATVTKCELMEASIVDIPANANAVRLYDRSTSVCLAAGMVNSEVPEIKTILPMNLKSKWKAVLAFLNIGEDKADETQLSVEQMESLNAEMERLQDENAQLKTKHSELETELNTAKEELTTLKADVTKKDGEISSLKEQVQNLKDSPSGDNGNLTPKNEPGAEEKENLATFSDKHADDYAALTARIKEEGLI